MQMFSSPGERYSKIIYNYKYFNDPNKYEDEIQKDDDLVELNEHVKKTYLGLL